MVAVACHDFYATLGERLGFFRLKVAVIARKTFFSDIGRPSLEQ
jgi:hypothetical protein